MEQTNKQKQNKAATKTTQPFQTQQMNRNFGMVFIPNIQT